ncbi:Protein of unknown function (DUF3551) [Bradyrhizobium sp. YR681]|uniref:DUF3551 domain-containing protein n=1 Tax=Bradyrhizobium sp. YR681 TaxID=1144344 RepID=UPI00026FBA0A|nr:DUF3551 domain-containing protein [Bradyrhizobium sp. YR681]EJN08955.1 Protein of unknown function (DUF3551) [Bradyrhizobium sp. YR681]
MHRHLSIAVLAAVSALAVAGTYSAASATERVQDSYCLQGRQSGYPGNCEFSSYQQCMATASGTNEGCGINPMRAYAPQRRAMHFSR